MTEAAINVFSNHMVSSLMRINPPPHTHMVRLCYLFFADAVQKHTNIKECASSCSSVNGGKVLRYMDQVLDW